MQDGIKPHCSVLTPSSVFIFCSVLFQGFTPDRLSSSCCHTAPDLQHTSPAKSFFKKAAAALFGGKKDKAKYLETLSESLFLLEEPIFL